jgi:PP-loop superfamily ATP-utilizing enzyme
MNFTINLSVLYSMITDLDILVDIIVLNPNVIKFKDAMSPQSKKKMKNLAYFCKEIINFL